MSEFDLTVLAPALYQLAGVKEFCRWYPSIALTIIVSPGT